MRVVCRACNTSCGTMNLMDFKNIVSPDSKNKPVNDVHALQHRVNELEAKIKEQEHEKEIREKMALIMQHSRHKIFAPLKKIQINQLIYMYFRLKCWLRRANILINA